MGRYRLGDIVRMTRKSLSITQEQLSESICSVETLSRIENGSQNPTRDTYELLMVRMGRIRSRAYSMLSVSDFQILEKMKQIEDYIKLYDFIKAETMLNEIEEKIGESILDQQFKIRVKSSVDYNLKRISLDDYLKESLKAIKLTIPKYGEISLSNWPLSSSEAILLTNIAIAYAEKEDFQNSISLMEEAHSALKQSYMEEQQRAILQVIVTFNLSKVYGITHNHEKAIEIADEGIEICRKFKLGNALPYLIYNIAWNKEKQIEMGVLSPNNKSEAILYLKRAYYIASAMQMTHMVHFIREHIMENFGMIDASFID